MNIENLTIKRARELLDNKEITSVELAEHYLGVIEDKNKELNAFLNVFKDEAIEMAKEADRMIDYGKAGALTGIPIAVKDNILIKGFVATSGSKILENYVSSYDATVIKKLRDSGAVFLGKTNLDEFAMGSSTENSAFGPTRNPHDTSRVPGGTSGGSAAAIAADMCVAALGSDTGGSIRQPASFCGAVGVKPTYGAVSRYGLMASVSSFDQIGPITKDVKDAEILFNLISEQDNLDSTSLPSQQENYLEKKLEDLKIGVPVEYFEAGGLDESVKSKVEKAASWFSEKGAGVKKISLKATPVALPVYYVILFSEASSNLARYDGIRYGFSADANNLWDLYKNSRGEGFGAEVKRRIMLGTYALSAGYYDAYYKKAKQVQAVIKDEFEKAFKDVDIIITPTSPTVAFKIGEKSADPLAMYAADIFTVPLNVAGLPGISVPCGEENGLPVGMQIIAPWKREDLLFGAGKFFEENYNNAS